MMNTTCLYLSEARSGFALFALPQAALASLA